VLSGVVRRLTEARAVFVDYRRERHLKVQGSGMSRLNLGSGLAAGWQLGCLKEEALMSLDFGQGTAVVCALSTVQQGAAAGLGIRSGYQTIACVLRD
jgi:hypothetical protein